MTVSLHSGWKWLKQGEQHNYLLTQSNDYKVQTELTRNRVRECELDSSGSGEGPATGSCEHGNETSVSQKV
jgi:hypothetical protein